MSVVCKACRKPVEVAAVSPHGVTMTKCGCDRPIVLPVPAQRHNQATGAAMKTPQNPAREAQLAAQKKAREDREAAAKAAKAKAKKE